MAIIVLVILFFWQNYPKTVENYWNKAKHYLHLTRKPTQKPLVYSGFGVNLPPYRIHGLDVSHYQAHIDWHALKQMKIGRDSLVFVFIKATEGEDYRDSFFDYNWKESNEVGFLRGAYHYYRPNVEPVIQAQNFINALGNTTQMLPPVLDIEERGDLDIEVLQKNLQIWLNLVEKHTKKKPLVYSNRNFYTHFLKEKFKKYPVWIAQYDDLNQKPLEVTNWIFWQHTCKGQANGIAPKIDLNVFRGSLEELKKLGIGN